MSYHFKATKVAYVLKEVPIADQPPKWQEDSVAVFSAICKTIDSANIRHVRQFEESDGAKGMWDSLHTARQDLSAGGRMCWLPKLVLACMTGYDIDSHLEKMSILEERLKALVTKDKPLTPNNIHSTALLISLPENWLSCVSLMMNKENVTSNRIILALKQESLRQKSRNKSDPVVSASKASTSNSNQNPGRRHQPQDG